MNYYYEVKTNYLEPVPDSDEFKRVSKTYLVIAVSVTDAESTIIEWHPSNFRDFLVESVKRTSLGDLRFSDGETYYQVKILDDNDGRIAKPKPFLVMYQAIDLKDALAKASKDWFGTEIEEIKKYKNIVDQDLTVIPEDDGSNYETKFTKLNEITDDIEEYDTDED